MRFNTLELRAFGPFTGHTLDFGTGAGLHLVYGPNEAGKSSTLRAIDAFLFGFAHNSDDNFVHPYDALRVGATLSGDDGTLLEAVRRKGRQKTLRDGDDREAVEEAQLSRLLGGASPETFHRLFHLDHAQLVAGGRQMLDQESSLGEKLFAGTGADPAVVLAQLRVEYEALFAPRAQNPALNAAIRRHDALRKELRALQLSAGLWERQRQIAEDLAQQLHACELRHAEQTAERDRLKRYLLAQSPLTQQREARERAAALESALTETTRQLLQHGDVIDELREALPVWENNGRQCALARKEAEAARKQAEALWHELEPGKPLDQTALRETLVRKGEIRRLAAREEVVLRDVDQAAVALRKVEARIAALREQDAGAGEPAAPTMLQTALEAARPLRNIDRECTDLAKQMEVEEAALTDDIAALGLWQGTRMALRRAPVPSLESVRRCEATAADLARQATDLERRRAEIEQAAEQNQARLTQVIGRDDVPSEAGLGRARGQRDAAWRAARTAWNDGVAPSDTGPDAARIWAEFAPETTPPGDLADAVEQATTATDDLADRLRREAGRVAEVALVEDELKRIAANQKEVSANQAALAENLAVFEVAWRELWAPMGITSPLPPGEMREWRERFTALLARADQLDATQRNHAAQTEHRDAAAHDLQAALANAADAVVEADAPFHQILAAAEACFTELAETKRAWKERRNALDALETKDLPEAMADLEAKERALEDWRGAWRQQVTPMGTPADTPTARMLTMLEQAEKIGEALQDEAAAESRAADLSGDIQDFETRVQTLVEHVAPELSGTEPGDVVRGLHAQLEEVRGHARELAQAKANANEAEDRLRELAEEAELTTFIADARLEDADTLRGRIAEIGATLAQTDLERKQLTQDAANANAELARMDGSDAAAAKAQEAEAVLAEIRTGVERYARLRVAAEALQRAIEAYRKRNEAPLLARSGELFARLTLGRFTGVQVDFDEKGAAQLVALRADSGKAAQPQALSEGTADQLYLALRLASVEAHMAVASPLPFIADDICINFDDDRAGAALEVLQELGAKTQVLLFTHHQHLADLAESHLGADTFTLHRLQPVPL